MVEFREHIELRRHKKVEPKQIRDFVRDTLLSIPSVKMFNGTELVGRDVHEDLVPFFEPLPLGEFESVRDRISNVLGKDKDAFSCIELDAIQNAETAQIQKIHLLFWCKRYSRVASHEHFEYLQNAFGLMSKRWSDSPNADLRSRKLSAKVLRRERDFERLRITE